MKMNLETKGFKQQHTKLSWYASHNGVYFKLLPDSDLETFHGDRGILPQDISYTIINTYIQWFGDDADCFMLSCGSTKKIIFHYKGKNT